MISICIATYKRPDQLEKLLRILILEVARPTTIEIVVCDNDANQSAKGVVDAAAKQADISVKYYCEPIQNISLARNCTIRQARGEWIAFIDDDEAPSADWLQNLLNTAQQHSADGVFGPVHAEIPGNAPRWIQVGSFFPTISIPTGSAVGMQNAAAGNALIKATMLRKIEGPFDHRFGLSGGEDTHLFGTLIYKHHARFISCLEAWVKENVSIARCNRSWLLRRSFRGGLIWSQIESELYRSNHSRYAKAVLTLLILIASTPLTTVCMLFPTTKSTVFLRKIASLSGQFAALFSLHYVEYK